MRTVHAPLPAFSDLCRRLERLDGLPVRAVTARAVLDRGESGPPTERPRLADWKSEPDLDPGWVAACHRAEGQVEPLAVIASRPWWPSCSRAAADALDRLWKHGLAVGLASLRLAREQSDPAPEALAQAGLLHGLGLWAAAAVDPEWLAAWTAARSVEDRRHLERATLGVEAATLGRVLAERWGLPRLTADAAWLHDAPGRLLSAAAEPKRLALVQAAFELAGRTPWAPMLPEVRGQAAQDPRVKLLIAEVQARCRGEFTDPIAPAREERITRENARLRLTVAALAAGQAARDRFLTALSESEPGESPRVWAERAGMAWCGEPGVSVARLTWGDSADCAGPTVAGRPPEVDLALGTGPREVARLRLWTGPLASESVPALTAALPAWRAWSRWVDHRVRLEERLESAFSALRDVAESEGPRLEAAKLEALAQFAAGAGHELNNPLAVIVGRAQLLLADEDDPKATRSLRAILAQAQRAHRILRDLMYVARPPEPRPRSCQPDEIWRSSLRDARADAEERGVLLVAESLEPVRRIWADPDALRHAADALLRNAIEATPRGGSVCVSAQAVPGALRWVVQDSGRGIEPAERPHLFDPFYCGRQAGRGLGLGLPRLARFLEQVGGEVSLQSVPGEGTRVLVRIPIDEPPKPPLLEPGSNDSRGERTGRTA